MDKVIEKYLVRFAPNQALDAPLIEDGRLVGLRFRRTETRAGKLVSLPDTEDVRSPLIISSIGSIPEPIPELPMKGELIDFEDWDTGKVRGFDNVFGLGNALTGKGNIKDSRKNAGEVSTQVVENYLLGAGGGAYDQAHRAAQASAERIADATLARPLLTPQQLSAVAEQVARHWRRTGFQGDVRGWIAAHSPDVVER